jgi:glutathione S-transferase
MKLYMHPVSTASRPVALLIAEKKLPVENVVVDLMTGAHHQEPYVSLNPNSLVPMLEDGDFRLTESSAILKYLADRFDLPEYPKELKARARVNEVMDWFLTQLYPQYGYGMIYPQLFPHHKRQNDATQAGTIEWGHKNSQRWLQILNDHWIGPDRNYLCGNSITIADYLATGIITLGEVVGCDLARYPNVTRWIGNMKKLPHYAKVNETFEGWSASVKEKADLVAVR